MSNGTGDSYKKALIHFFFLAIFLLEEALEALEIF